MDINNCNPNKIIDIFCEMNEQLIRTSSLPLLAVREQMFSITSERLSNMRRHFTTWVDRKTSVGL